MLKRFLAAIGLSATTAAASASPPYAPYADDAANSIYNMLFCDLPALFEPEAAGVPARWKATLQAEPADRETLRALAENAGHDGRVRALAYRRLRVSGATVPRGVLLGVITEVGLPQGLDTLAAFSEGGVRYLNFSGKMVFVEGAVPQTRELLPRLFAAAQVAVDTLKPLAAARRAPPANGFIRFTFLTSDGMYFGEGPIEAMASDGMGGPIVRYATELMQTVVGMDLHKAD